MLNDAAERGDVEELMYLGGVWDNLHRMTVERVQDVARCKAEERMMAMLTGDDQLLSAEQAAAEAGPRFNARFFYDNADALPFTKRGPGRRVSFHLGGLREWKRTGFPLLTKGA